MDRPTASNKPTLATLVCFALGVLFLMLPALWNKFPFIFADSGTYIDAAIRRALPGDRSVFYSLFILPLHLKITLWPVVVAQAVVTVYLIRVFFKAFSSRFDERQVLLAIALLSAFTSLPWFVGQIMPDLFAGLLILAIATVVLRHDRIGRLDRFFLPALVGLFITTHLSYLLVAAGTLGFSIVLLLVARYPGTVAQRLFARANLLVVAAMVVAVGMMLAINVVAKKGLTFAATGNVMLMAKVLDQGIGIDYLTARCPDRPLPICAILPKLKEIKRDAVAADKPIGNVSDNFLWGGPLASLGGMQEVTKYASEISSGAIRAYPGRFIAECLRGFVAQLGKFQLGDDMIRYPAGNLVHDVIAEKFPPATINHLMAARQYQQTLHIEQFRLVSNLFLALSVVAIAAFLLLRWRSAPAVAHCVLIVLVGFLVNDLVTGALSAVHDRYGSRAVWLFALLAIFIVTEFIKDRSAGRSTLNTSNPI